MSEYLISSDKENEPQLNFIENELKETLVFAKGKQKKFSGAGRLCLNYEVCQYGTSKFKSELYEIVATIIAYKNKENFILKKVSINNEESIFGFIILKAILFADLDIYKERIKKKLKEYDKICLDGVDNFLLRDIKEEWEELCDILVINSDRLRDKKEYRKFLRCITSSIPQKNRIINLVGKDEIYVANEYMEKIYYSFQDLEKLDYPYNVLAAIIESNPNKIYILKKELPEVLKEGIKLLFEEKNIVYSKISEI